MDSGKSIESLLARGIVIRIVGGDIEYEGTRGALTEDTLESIRENKPALLAFLADPPAVDAEPNPYSTPCSMCGGRCVVVDSLGQNCVDCRARPGETKDAAAPHAKPANVVSKTARPATAVARKQRIGGGPPNPLMREEKSGGGPPYPLFVSKGYNRLTRGSGVHSSRVKNDPVFNYVRA